MSYKNLFNYKFKAHPDRERVLGAAFMSFKQNIPNSGDTVQYYKVLIDLWDESLDIKIAKPFWRTLKYKAYFKMAKWSFKAYWKVFRPFVSALKNKYRRWRKRLRGDEL